MQENFDLTFGVELEFIVVYQPQAFVNHADQILGYRKRTRFDDSDDEEFSIPATEVIEICLERAGIPAILVDVYAEEELDEDKSQPSGERFSRWTVTEDFCKLSEEEKRHLSKGFKQETVELASRIFGFKDGNFHSELARVLGVLSQLKLDTGCEIFTNSTTGLHVHIGRRFGIDLPLQMCKRVLQLATAHERNIDAMHMASRVLAPMSFADTGIPLYLPPSAIHRHNLHDTLDANMFKWLERVEATDSVRELQDLSEVSIENKRISGHRCAYNFDNMGRGVKNTIEFRQHAGTLDLVQVCAWVSFVCRLVEYCHQTKDVEFMHLLCRATDMDFKLVDLLVALQVHTDVLMHYNRDGGEAFLGFLPARNTHYVDESFDNVIGQNDHEQEQNAAAENVDAIITRKCTLDPITGVSYIGLIPSSGLVYCHDAEHLKQLLIKCFARAHGEIYMYAAQGGGVSALESEARTLVFGKLALIYADQRFGAQRAIQHHLAGWASL